MSDVEENIGHYLRELESYATTDIPVDVGGERRVIVHTVHLDYAGECGASEIAHYFAALICGRKGNRELFERNEQQDRKRDNRANP